MAPPIAPAGGWLVRMAFGGRMERGHPPRLRPRGWGLVRMAFGGRMEGGARDAMGLGKSAQGGGEGHRGTLALYLSSASSSRTLLDIVASLTPFFILMRLILRSSRPADSRSMVVQ